MISPLSLYLFTSTPPTFVPNAGKIVDAVATTSGGTDPTTLILGMSGIVTVGALAVFVRVSQLAIVSEQVCT